MGTPSKSPHSKFLGVGCSSNSLPMSAPYPNSANHSVNPLLPDFTKGTYATDEFRMYSFKVEKCPHDGNHNWRQCPYTHTGDNDRRRDPKKYLYKPEWCEDFSYRSCEFGDQCPKAHGKFEKGLHPDFYRTHLCRDKSPCTRSVCFFAHTREELRKPSSSLSAYSRYLADVALGFEPAPCPVPDSPSTPVTLPKSPSTIEMSKNAPNNPLESSYEQNLQPQPSLSAANSLSTTGISNNDPDNPLEGLSSNEQSILSRPSLSADSPRPETPFSSNMEDGFPGKNDHTYYDPFSSILTSTQSRKQKQSMLSPSRTDFSPRNVNHSLPQPLIRVTTELASPTNSQVSIPALQATQPQQTQSPSSSNPAFSSPAADNSLDDGYETWFWPKPDVAWVDALLDEPEDQS